MFPPTPVQCAVNSLQHPIMYFVIKIPLFDIFLFPLFQERFGVPIATQYNPWGVFPSATASYCPVCGMDGHRAGLSALVFR